MQLSITPQVKDNYLLIESKGSLQTKEDLFMHSQRQFTEILKHDTRKILIDDMETHFPLELSSYFGLVQEYVDNYPPEIRSLLIARVVSPEYKEVADNWETLCVSRGLHFYAFTSLEEARGWIVEMI